jgi:D-3-phosphoglycerate dehydrogenase / 2-oxoglutarate reductase
MSKPMKRKVLISAPYLQPVIDRFRPIFDQNNIELVIPTVNERLDEDELIDCIADIDGVICGDDRFTEKVLRAAVKLKVISKWGTGIDSIDRKACQKLGVQIRNTPNAFSIPVADSVIGYMLCFARNLPWMDRYMHNAVWEKLPGRSLEECILGVIGVGNVGKTVVRRAIGFGMQVLGNDIVEVPEDFIQETGIQFLSKEALLSKADFVSLNCDLNPSSYHLMNSSMFSLMKPSAVVINTSRGPVIKEEDLVKALEDKKISGAALDVFEHEPLPASSPLMRMDNVMLAPHNANSSPNAWEVVHNNTIKNLLDVLRSNP